MWDSAKKPIKVRSVLQPNGMRHFIVNEETEETHKKSLLQQKRNNNKIIRSSGSLEGNSLSGQQQSSNEKHGTENNNILLPESQTKTERARRGSVGNSCSLLLCSSNILNDSSGDNRWESLIPQESDTNFFGVSGSKIYNSKMYKGQHSRHFYHHFPHGTKSNVEFTRYPHLRADVLDFVPVKSPVIKKLISGRVNSSGHHEQEDMNDKCQKFGSNQRNGTPSTTLCSRIMTWIDLEVKRNAVKKSTSGSLPFNSADLSIVNELMPDEYGQSKNNGLSSPPASEISSSASSSSGESSNTSSCMSSSSSTCSNSTVSFPKLIPCWRKEGALAEGSKTKKSVRIADDLPRWGKMKRRLRRKTLSLNELYEDEHFSTYNSGNKNKTDYSNIRKLESRQGCFSSVSDLFEERNNLQTEGGVSLIGCGGECEDRQGKETDSFLVRDERLLTSGKLMVHIFLPQTESASGRSEDNSGNLSGRSEDSTS